MLFFHILLYSVLKYFYFICSKRGKFANFIIHLFLVVIRFIRFVRLIQENLRKNEEKSKSNRIQAKKKVIIHLLKTTIYNMIKCICILVRRFGFRSIWLWICEHINNIFWYSIIVSFIRLNATIWAQITKFWVIFFLLQRHILKWSTFNWM